MKRLKNQTIAHSPIKKVSNDGYKTLERYFSETVNKNGRTNSKQNLIIDENKKFDQIFTEVVSKRHSTIQNTMRLQTKSEIGKSAVTTEVSPAKPKEITLKTIETTENIKRPMTSERFSYS